MDEHRTRPEDYPPRLLMANVAEFIRTNNAATFSNMAWRELDPEGFQDEKG